MVPKMIKLPKDVIAQIQRIANKRARQTGERPNFSAIVRELLREALATATKTKKRKK